jgi:gluconolactonase
LTIALSVIANDLDHPEGVAWSPRGWIVAGGEAGQIYAVDPEERAWKKIADTGGYALGIALDGADNIYVCDMGRRAVLRIDQATGAIDDLTTGRAEVSVRVPNFPVFSAGGSLFFSDSGDWPAADGVLFVRTPTGEVLVASEEPSNFPNGLAIDPSGQYLYVVESSAPRISRHRLLGDDRIGTRETVVELPDLVPDGLAFTADGALLISCYRPDSIFLWDGDALALLVHDWTGLLLSAPTNLAFFGDGLDRLAGANLAGHTLIEIGADLVGSRLNYPLLNAPLPT